MPTKSKNPQPKYGAIELDVMDPQQFKKDAKKWGESIHLEDTTTASHGMPSFRVWGLRQIVWKFILSHYDDDYSTDDFDEFFQTASEIEFGKLVRGRR